MDTMKKRTVSSTTVPTRRQGIHLGRRWTFIICLGVFLALMDTAFAGQGVQRMLYTVPNSTFIENPSGDSGVVTINDTSGSISTLQTSINNARSSNPNSIIVIDLQRGATYTVSTASLTLGSQECLIASGARIQAANSSVTVPLVQISSGASMVSIAGGTFDGNGAGINAIYAPAAARVNVDKVVAKNCGLDCILLKGQGNTTYENEMTVTRCDCSGSAAHAGISIQNSTQTAVLDNDCHDNFIGIYISAAWANVANNTCENNTTGIDVAGGDDDVVANNTCTGNATGILVGGTKNMIGSNLTGGNSTAGISSTGNTSTFVDNLFASGNAVNFSSGGTSDNFIAYETAVSASGENYFYPPLIDNQHTATTIVNGMGRTDVTVGSTSIDNVQSQYNSAVSGNPNNVIVLHLNGTFTVGANSLTLSGNTCVLLNGTIVINSSTTASAAISCSGTSRISISGGTIDAENNTGITGISVLDCSMIQIDGMTLQNFGPNVTSVPGSDTIHFSEFGSGSGTPLVVTRCYVNSSASRAVWSQCPGVKGYYSDNTLIGTRAGIDCDSKTYGAVCMFNLCVSNLYGLWYEQGATHNVSIGNVCNYNSRYDLDAGNSSDTTGTQFNNYLCNVGQGFTGIVTGATGTGTWTSDNFLFNNVILNASIKANEVGTNNYFAQNYLSGGSLTTSAADVYFNSPDVDGNLQVHDSNSGLAVAVQGAATTNGAPVVTAASPSTGDGTGDDEWQFIPTDSGFYKVINQNSGLAMVVQGASTSSGAPIIQYAYSGGTTYNDEWLIQPVGNGLYNFVNRLSGLYLDVPGASITPGTQLDQWQSNSGANQQFSLVEDTVLTATPDFSISASPASASVTPGNGANYTVTITGTNGFNGSIGLTIGGLPTGATANFNPSSVTGSGTSTLSVSTSSSTPAGNYTLTITGTSGSLQHSTTVTLIVSDFTISVLPSSQTVVAGNSTNYTATISAVNGFSGTVTFSASGLPTGATANFVPTSVNSAGSSTMTVTTTITTAPGTYTVTVTGTSGSLAHSTTVTLIINAPPNFSLSASPSSLTVVQGTNAVSTITVNPVNGFNSSVSLSASGLPSGVTASFNPSSTTTTSALTLSASSTATTGTSTVTVKGITGSLTNTTTISLTVQASTTLPLGWTDVNIGAVGLTGSASYNNGTFTVSGSGADIWNTSDQYNYAYQSVSGDQTIIARVVSENGTQSYAKAGVMLRETLATNSVEASVLLTPTNGVAMEIRPTTGAASINVVGWVKGPVPPQWVKLARSGSVFTAFYSTDGSTWTQFASTNVTMATSETAGLAVTSHDNTALNTATFDNVIIAAPATINPIADAFVRDGTYATTNFGTATNLDIKKSSTGYNRIAFLKFDVTSISTLSGAKLRLYGAFINTNGISATTAHQQTNNTWTETGITWNNMPAAGAAITTVNVSTNTQYWEWDVTSYVQAQKSGGATQISIQLQNDASTPQAVTVNSREAPANNPQLFITP
jgi:parallel beta-helix repeat protein